MGGEGKMYRESNMETCIAIYKTDGRGKLLYNTGRQVPYSVMTQRGGRGGGGEGGSRGRGYMCTYS